MERVWIEVPESGAGIRKLLGMQNNRQDVPIRAARKCRLPECGIITATLDFEGYCAHHWNNLQSWVKRAS